ncbi:MAG TPA: lipocalin-like domain-containing protein [Sphingomicrobium sp.]|nr:lipocalin-like domain-containing protein [Sphingomicrobium sp.]
MMALGIAALLGTETAIAQACPNITGTWRLVSASSRGPHEERDDAPYGTSPSGLLIYTADGHVTAIVSSSGRPPLSVNDRITAPVEERASAFATSFAYAGRYKFLCDRVVHDVEVATVPNWVGTQMTRKVRIVGNRLILSTPPIAKGGTVSSFDLVWERQR